MRIVKKTLKGDLMGDTGFKSVGTKRRAPSAAPKPDDPAQRLLERLSDDDLTVVTEPIPVKHGKAIVLRNADHMEIPQIDAEPNGKAAVRAAAPPAAPAPSGGNTTAAAGGSRKEALASLLRRDALPQQGQEAAAAKPTTIDGDVALARSVLAEALYREFGAPGSKVQQPKGMNFLLHPKRGAGVVRTQHTLMLPLPEGHATSHAADVVVELENGALLMLDVVPSAVSTEALKALAYDALQLRRLDLAFSVLVFVRGVGGGMAQDQAQAIGHGYDVHFGVDAGQVHSEQAFSALRSRIATWLKAAASA